MTILVKPAFLTIILLLTDCYLFSDKKGENPGFIESSQNRLKEFLLETTNEPIFLEKANIRELLKSKIQKENSILESYLRKRLINDGIADKLVNQKPVRENFKTELGFIKNLGGLRAVSQRKVVFSHGDWTDLFLDGFSGKNLKKTELIRSFITPQEIEISFFIRRDGGYPPVDFSFIGFESEFFLFQGDGSMRYAKSDTIDYSIRIEAFQDMFQNILRSNPGATLMTYGDYSLYFIPGKTPVSFYIFLVLKILITFSSIFLVISFGLKVSEYVRREKSAEKEQALRLKRIKEDYTVTEEILTKNDLSINSILFREKEDHPEKITVESAEPAISKAEKIG